jgi:hypothetical protein
MTVRRDLHSKRRVGLRVEKKRRSFDNLVGNDRAGGHRHGV